jgi:hypothetical protein
MNCHCHKQSQKKSQAQQETNRFEKSFLLVLAGTAVPALKTTWGMFYFKGGGDDGTFFAQLPVP